MVGTTLQTITGNLAKTAYYVESTFKEVVGNPTWRAFGRTAKVSGYKRLNNMNQIKDLGRRCPAGFSTGKYEVSFAIETDAIKDLGYLEAIMGGVTGTVAGDGSGAIYIVQPTHKSLTVAFFEDTVYDPASPNEANKLHLVKGVIVKSATLTIETNGLMHVSLDCSGSEDPTTLGAIAFPADPTDDIFVFGECGITDSNNLSGIVERLEITLNSGSDFNFGVGHRKSAGIKTGSLSVQLKFVNTYDPSKSVGFEQFSYGASGALAPEAAKVQTAGTFTLLCGHNTQATGFTTTRIALQFVLPNFTIFEYQKDYEWGEQVMESVEGECTGVTVNILAPQ